MARPKQIFSFALNSYRLQVAQSRSYYNFRYNDLQICLSDEQKEKPFSEHLSFGKHFTDHMLLIEWERDIGWKTPLIENLSNFSIHPGARTFHYAAGLFEGMKAMKGDDGVIRLFRPEENMKRMNTTAARTCMPTFDSNELLKLIKKLIQIDRSWVPEGRNKSLYIRPTMIGTDHTLGVQPPDKALLYVLLCPVGYYYSSGAKPVSLMADPDYCRAWPGGSGYTKMASNYAPTPYVQKKAQEAGCEQVLWLFGDEHYATEVGTMNFFVFMTNEKGKKELVTHPLDGLVLPGVVRKSVIEMAKGWKSFDVSERRITMGEIVKANKEGRVHEVFGTGTACVVSPVGKILFKGEWINLPEVAEKTSLTHRILNELQDIQYGKVKNHPWTTDIDDI